MPVRKEYRVRKNIMFRKIFNSRGKKEQLCLSSSSFNSKGTAHLNGKVESHIFNHSCTPAEIVYLKLRYDDVSALMLGT